MLHCWEISGAAAHLFNHDPKDTAEKAVRGAPGLDVESAGMSLRLPPTKFFGGVRREARVGATRSPPVNPERAASGRLFQD
jgi:hypothetical protein